MYFRTKTDSKTGKQYMSVKKKGRDLLLDPFLNKGSAFPLNERKELGIMGLLPPVVSTFDEQLERTYENYRNKNTNIEKYIYLVSLQERNITLFYQLVYKHIDEMMPIIYTPVVGEACQKFFHIYRRPQGIYIDYTQKDCIEDVLKSWPNKDVSVIVVTDGERILGLGDQGAGGMGIPVGKLALYTLCAGVSPYTTLPIVLDVGTNNEERIDDPLYLGLRQKRVKGDDYQKFIDNFVVAVKKVYPKALLQWEDFYKDNAIHQLEKFRNELCSFNDDIQGTASVVLAGIYAGLRITEGKMKDQRIVIAGAGASSSGISDLIVSAMIDEGMNEADAIKNIWTLDSKGLVVRNRENLEKFKTKYAREASDIENFECTNKTKITLEEAVKNIKPTILLGTSATPSIFTEEIIKAQTEGCKRPMIFALSNPTSKAECTPEEAIKWSDGKAIVATGSPFDPVTYKGKTYRIGQGNNAYVFPGVGLGIAVSKAKFVTDGMFLEAAKALANKITQKDLDECALYPPFSEIRECSLDIACAVIKRAVDEGLADSSVLENVRKTVAESMWVPEYLPMKYEQ